MSCSIAFEELGGYVLEDRIAAILQGLGIPHRQEARLTELSGGERVKVALAKILAADADLLYSMNRPII